MYEGVPEEFKKRIQAKKNNGGGYSPASSCTAAVPKSEKPYFQFQNEGIGHFWREVQVQPWWGGWRWQQGSEM